LAHCLTNCIPTAQSFLLIPSIRATGRWKHERDVSEAANTLLRFTSLLTVETNQRELWASGPQRAEVVEFRLCYVLVHAAWTNAVMIDVSESDAVVLERFDPAFIRHGDDILVQHLPDEFPKIVRGIVVVLTYC
jgi:hypothetical protein